MSVGLLVIAVRAADHDVLGVVATAPRDGHDVVDLPAVVSALAPELRSAPVAPSALSIVLRVDVGFSVATDEGTPPTAITCDTIVAMCFVVAALTAPAQLGFLLVAGLTDGLSLLERQSGPAITIVFSALLSTGTVVGGVVVP